MDLDCLAAYKYGLERLNTKPVKCRSAVQKNRMFADHVFQNVPNDRLLALDHFARLLDRGGVLVPFEFVIDERLEKLKRHLLRQAALMKFQFRSNDDHR